MLFQMNLLAVTLFIFVESMPPAEAENDRENLAKEIENDIRIGNWTAADEKLDRLGGEKALEINLIVHELYSNDKGNFALLNDYAWNSSDSAISHRILEELWTQMKDNGHEDFNELCDIYKTILHKVINSKAIAIDSIAKANEMLKNEIRPRIIEDARHRFEDAIVRNTFELIRNVSNQLYSTNELIFDETICGGINGTFRKIHFRQLIHFIWNFELASQKSAALLCIFSQFYSNMESQPNEILIISFYINQLISNYDLPDHESNEIQELIEKLPQSVRNLYFVKDICLRNVASGKYISPEVDYDKWKHRVTKANQNPLSIGAIWHAQPIDEFKLKFQNKKYSKEFLFTDNEHLGILNFYFRQVFTWNAKVNYTDNRLIWRIQLRKNMEITLATTAHNDAELLCFDDDHDDAFTTKFTANQCYWVVEIC